MYTTRPSFASVVGVLQSVTQKADMLTDTIRRRRVDHADCRYVPGPFRGIRAVEGLEAILEGSGSQSVGSGVAVWIGVSRR